MPTFNYHDHHCSLPIIPTTNKPRNPAPRACSLAVLFSKPNVTPDDQKKDTPSTSIHNISATSCEAVFRRPHLALLLLTIRGRNQASISQRSPHRIPPHRP